MGSLALINGTIYTSFTPLKKTNSLLIYNGYFKIIGNSNEILDFAKREKIEIIDLKNKFAIPGFIDAHMHLDELGEFIKGINLKETTSIKNFCYYISKEKDKFKTWIFGHGWADLLPALKGEFPEVSRVTPLLWVLLYYPPSRYCGRNRLPLLMF
jgi:predicted amidohydrolase YtcJ